MPHLRGGGGQADVRLLLQRRQFCRQVVRHRGLPTPAAVLVREDWGDRCRSDISVEPQGTQERRHQDKGVGGRAVRLKAVITVFPCVSLPFFAVPLSGDREGERSGTARKGRETEGKPVITAFKREEGEQRFPAPAAPTARPAGRRWPWPTPHGRRRAGPPRAPPAPAPAAAFS
eukprot:SAG22_NODE_5090_length_1088_cov_12.683519_1_plen_174_part_00